MIMNMLVTGYPTQFFRALDICIGDKFVNKKIIYANNNVK